MADLLTPSEAGELLRKKREAKGLTQEQLAESLKLNNPNYLSMLEKGRVNVARSKYLPALARLLRLDDQEVRSINPDLVVEIMPPSEPLEVTNVHRVPVLNMAAAGPAFYSDANVLDIEYVLDDLYRPGMLVVRVVGESMSPTIQHGDHVYVDIREMEPAEGRVYFVHIIGDGFVLKRARNMGGQWFLMSDNPAHPPLMPEEAQIVGRAYHHQPKGSAL